MLGLKSRDKHKHGVWGLTGTYLEQCSCDAICPCSWSGFTWPSTHDRCQFVLNFKIKEGDVQGVDVDGLLFAIVGDTPKHMPEGGWRIGVLLDDRATPEQVEKMAAVLTGQLGGPPAALGPLIGEMLGLELVPASYEQEGHTHRLRFGDKVDLELREFVAPDNSLRTDASYMGSTPAALATFAHPITDVLTIAPPVRGSVDAFGISYGIEGSSGYVGPFSWGA
jgi:hypothetical protein